jgi:hypothetical protein
MSKMLIDRSFVEQALGALESCDARHPSDGGQQYYDDVLVECSINSLRAALEQPEQCTEESDCTGMPWCRIRNECQRAALTQEEQEPVEIKPPNPEGATQCIVRWMAETPAGWVGAWDREALERFTAHPPRREWVSLTENELGELMRDSCGYPMCPNGDDLAFARAIEAALKERNHG